MSKSEGMDWRVAKVGTALRSPRQNGCGGSLRSVWLAKGAECGNEAGGREKQPL